MHLANYPRRKSMLDYLTGQHFRLERLHHSTVIFDL